MDFEPLKNTRILDVALGKPVNKIPVWVMRQAGRYLPEYQELRKKHTFFEILQTPQLVTEVTLQPLRRFDVDAAIIFSDILVVPKAMGMDIQHTLSRGIHLTQPLTSPQDVDKLVYPVNVGEKLKHVFDAITLTRRTLRGKVPLLGFSGAPCSLMHFMIGGKTERPKTKDWLENHAQTTYKLLDMLTEVVVDYLVGQIEAGAQMVQLFETYVEYMSKPMFEKFCLPSIRKVSSSVRDKLKRKGNDQVPMIIFAKGITHSLKELSESGYEVISVDWTIDPEKARKMVRSGVTLQGNLNPSKLYSSSAEVAEETKNMVIKFTNSRYIANLGHGVPKDVDPEQIKTFVDTVHAF